MQLRDFLREKLRMYISKTNILGIFFTGLNTILITILIPLSILSINAVGS